jgi:hypothetical protein
MNFFNYITGIASILGLVLQIRDVFPKHRNLRKNILLLILGTFIGSLIGGLKQVQVNISTQQSPTEIIALVIGTGSFVIIGLIIIGLIFIKDEKKQNNLGVALFFLLFFFAFIIPISKPIGNKLEKNENFNLDEIKSLVDMHETNKNFERSIELLEIMKSMIKKDDIRIESINSRVESIKKKQLKEERSEGN